MEVKAIEERLFITPVQTIEGETKVEHEFKTHMYIRDLNGDEYRLQATSTVNEVLNGTQTLTCTIESNKTNDLFIDNVAEMWEIIDHSEVEYKVIFAKKKGKGDKLTVDIQAKPLFFDKFDTDRVYETYDSHMTALECFKIVFGGSGFNFLIGGSFTAVQWQGFGKGDTRLALFKKAIDRYKAEFKIVGNTIYLENLIGRDTSIMYRYKLNASNIVQENDATKFWTYARGFGDFSEGDQDNAKLKTEYTSPLASIPGIGLRHAPPTYDGRVSNIDTMKDGLKELVDSSLKISVSTDIHDLRKQNYEMAQPENGDRVFLIDERIGLNDEVRIVNITTKKDWEGNILDLKLTIGSESLVKRHQSELRSATQMITELFNGTRKIDSSMLDAAITVATEALKAAQTELKFSDNGITAIDKTDPNYVTIFNSAGIGVSTDGGNTFENAITGFGINASMIVTGILSAVDIYGVNIEGSKFTTSDPDYGTTIVQNGTITQIGEYGSTKINRGHIECLDGTTSKEIIITPADMTLMANNNIMNIEVLSDGYRQITGVDYMEVQNLRVLGEITYG